jgi:hypothetical protein
MKRRLTWYALAVTAAAAIFSLPTSQFGHANESGGLRPEPSKRARNDSLVVHEWGTFTSLQDEQGNAIGGINVDDEPVPEFVHRIASFLLQRPEISVPALFKGAPRCHPDVTMRLETPVVYFYPRRGETLPLKLDVEVSFRSGWLSEYYPDANVEAPGVEGHTSFGPITTDTTGRLRWNNLHVGTDLAGRETSSRVWLAPRAVQAANVTSAAGESERFLFYRGVGRVDSPLSVSRAESGKTLVFTSNFSTTAAAQPSKLSVPSLWLVDIRADNVCAFREIEGFEVPADGQPHSVGTTAATFDEAEFNQRNLDMLRARIRSALIADGLFDDEADALLSTWELSYFQTPGLRLFYLLPRAWTDRVLPLSLSIEAHVVRTMVGRIEIVTPEQRQLLTEIAAGQSSNAEWLFDASQNGLLTESAAPGDYRAYQALGRFRNALILDELKRNPTPTLKAFVDGYGLHSYPVAD